MNKTKKIFNCILCFMFVIALSLNVFAVFPATFKSVRADSEKHTVQFMQERYVAQTGNGNTLSFTILLNTVLTYDLKVTYHTESYSAIDGEDFIGVDEASVIIPSGKDSAQISIEFTPTKFVTVLEKENYSRMFLVVLDETNAPYDAETGEQDVIIGELNVSYGVLSGSFVMPIEQQSSSFAFATEYHNFLNTGKKNIKADAYDTKSVNRVLQTADDTWYRYSQQFGADVYASFYVPRITVDGEPDDLKQNFWLGAYNANDNVQDFMHIRRQDAVDSDADSFPAEAQLYFFANDFKSPYKKDHDWIPVDKYNFYGNDWKILYKDPLMEDDYGNKSLGFVKVPCSDSANKYALRFENELPWAAGFATSNSNDDYVVTMRLVDDKAPVLLSTNVDDSALARTKKIRFTMRFDEPVYATDLDATVDLKFYRGVGYVSISCKYVGGNYSDTLVFEGSAKEDNVYSEYAYSYTESNLFGHNTISDLSFHTDEYSKIGYNNTAGVLEEGATNKKLEGGKQTHIQVVKKGETYSFDYNKPQMTLVNKSGISTDYKYRKTHRFDIKITNTSKAKVYYTWNTDSSLYRTKDKFQGYINYTNENGNDTVSVKNTITSETENTAYYLHVLIVAKNGLTVADTSKSIYFDTVGPTLNVATNAQDNTLASKMFTLEYNDVHSKIKTVSVILSTKDGTKSKEVLLYDYRSGYCSPNYEMRYSQQTNNYIGHYIATLFNVDKDLIKVADGEAYYPIDEALKELVGDNERATIGFRFKIQDASDYTVNSDNEVLYDEDGNFSYYPALNKPVDYYTFDMRQSFQTEQGVYIDSQQQQPLSDVDAVSVYDLSSSSSITSNIFKISVSTNQSIEIPTNAGTFALTVVGSNIDKLKTDNGTIEIETENKAVITGKANASGEGSEHTISVSGLMPGRYCFTPSLIITGGGVPVELVADDVVFYVTYNKNETTSNYESLTDGNLVLINKVCQLQETRYQFMGMPGDKPKSMAYGATYDRIKNQSTGGSAYPTFSSEEELKKYLMFMEYQDLYIITLDETTVTALKTGIDVSYVKAPSDKNITPMVGQRWIRYKRTTWTPSSTSQTDWVFYYLDTITVSKNPTPVELQQYATFSTGDLYKNSALVSALEHACKVIADNATIINLVDSDHLYSNNSPKLLEEQIHPYKITATQTFMGSYFASAISYDGDSKIYKNVSVNDVEYPLSSNYKLTVTPNTVLYYRHSSASDWSRLLTSDGTSLREALSSVGTGLFELREIDDNGMHDFMVYIDTDVPRVNVRIKTQIEEETYLSSKLTKIACNKFEFISMEGELDDYAYVAIFSYPFGRLQEVYYGNEIAGKTLSGNYTVRVGDRSGNQIDIILLMKVDEIDLTIEENETTGKVVVKCSNRNASEVLSYEVKCNSRILENVTYKESNYFNQAGVYTVTMVDIYGKTAEVHLAHSKTAPQITWYYLDGNYEPYDEKAENQPMKITPDEVNPSRYNIVTSRIIRFKLDNGMGIPKFEFTGLTPQDYTVNSTGNVITVNKINNWLLKIWYEEDDSYYEEYYCIADQTAPEITVATVGPTYTYPDSTYLNESFTTIPNSLKYEVGDIGEQSVVNGSAITAEYITVSATDDNGVRSLQVYINNKLVDNTDGKRTLKYFDEGEYRIVATDIYGNVRTFTLSNSKHTNATFLTDDSNAEEEGSLNKVLYGNQKARVLLHEDAEVEFLVTENGVKKYYKFSVVNGVVSYGNYIVFDDEDGIRSVRIVWDETPVYVFGEAGNLVNTWINLKTENNYAVALNAKRTSVTSSEYELKFAVICLSEMQQVEIRVSSQTSQQPSYMQFILSKSVSDIPIFSGDKQLTTNRNGDIIFANNVLTLGEIPEDVSTVYVAYSQNNTRFDSYAPVYGTEDSKTFNASEKGFYSIKITNIYGNSFAYVVNLTDASEVLVIVTYADGMEQIFTSNHQGVIRSNGFITVQTYGSHVFTVDGKENEVVAENDISKFGIYTEGPHTVTVTDKGGSSVTFDLEIGFDASFAFNENWIVGFEDGTVYGDEHFTKNALSLQLTTSVCYVGIEYYNNETGKQVKETPIFDKLTDSVIDDEELLNKCLAVYGDGVYTIFFRSVYGDLVTHTVNYRQTSTLSVIRKTVMNGNGEDCVITDDTDIIYSSNVIIFKSCATNGKLTVNGVSVSLNAEYTINFNTLSGEASFEYPVTYTDEYGFVHSFKAVLLRRNVEIDTSSMKVVELRNKLYTSSLVSVVFGEDFSAKVEYDGNTAVEYVSGSKLDRDGEYLFVVYDIAGNATTYFVIRNSYCKFSFEEVGEGRKVISGMVTNVGVVFHSLGSNAQITKIVNNGKEIKDKVMTTFTGIGHWELIIEDEIGNSEYFEFTIINHSVGTFSFDAPYGYTVSEVWYTNNNDVRQLTGISGEFISLEEDGLYYVVVVSKLGDVSIPFAVTIDTTPPTATLNGVDEGGSTIKEIMVENLSSGDTVYVYKDGSLANTYAITSPSDKVTISEEGKYHVVVVNAANVSKEFTFEKLFVANTSGSVLIIIACGVVVLGLFFGLLYRNRSRVDK